MTNGDLNPVVYRIIENNVRQAVWEETRNATSAEVIAEQVRKNCEAELDPHIGDYAVKLAVRHLGGEVDS